ncbi:BQ5605_C022g09484 [Microbotryum silenes-dioicae]|uniref:BQ5605_C022g09484 protein n=1 Tax=Microbotryum silenes-dioicae TaxID=796604 RepID=A0A2X0MKS1_9BASI|nr:BQ5605_C022g09484 [Microbotryum silenes-dioicae]
MSHEILASIEGDGVRMSNTQIPLNDAHPPQSNGSHQSSSPGPSLSLTPLASSAALAGLVPAQIFTPATPLPSSPSAVDAQFAHVDRTSPSRPRAGTMPSTLHLGGTSSLGSNYANVLGRKMMPPSLMLKVPGSSYGASVSLPTSGHATPLGPEFAFSSPLLHNGLIAQTNPSPPLGASASAGGEANSSAATSRIRSGSLTLPSSGLSNAFGPTVFASGDWAPRPVDVNVPPMSGSSGLRSPDNSAYGDGDSHVRTLDYLGLDGDAAMSGFGEATSPSPGESMMRGDAAAPAGMTQRLPTIGGPSNSSNNTELSHAHTRLRSNTVAAFPRSQAASNFGLLGSSVAVGGATNRSPVTVDTDVFGSSTGSGAHGSDGSIDSTRLLYATSGAQNEQEGTDALNSIAENEVSMPGSAAVRPLSPGGRARAATIGILDESREITMSRQRARAGTTIGLTPHVVSMGMYNGRGGPDHDVEGSPVDSMMMGLRGINLGQMDENLWNSTRPRTPEAVAAASITPPGQQPTRSLWIGNLDPRTTPAELQNVFAPYGAIESLRLIPEKECGFVNFVSIGDAVRAKEDVLNRLGGQLNNSSKLVRIGFGKDISLAGNMSSMTQMRTASGPILLSGHAPPQHHQNSHPGHTGGLGGLASGTYNGPEELNPQMTPTRALWIGSIPSTTTPNQLLNVFAAFGPIESARVLTHKSCGFINYERLDDAISARKALNGREILGVGVGGVRIGFAKVPTKIINGNDFCGSGGFNNMVSMSYTTLQHLGGANGVSLEQQVADSPMSDFRSNLVMAAVSNPQFINAQKSTGALHSPVNAYDGQDSSNDESIETAHFGSVTDLQLLVRELSDDSPDVEAHIAQLATPRPAPTYHTSIPLQVLSDPRYGRRYSNVDAPRLRDLRKRLDSPQTSTDEVDTIAFEILDECCALASDYIGNTIVQKLFERCSLAVRMAMLERVGPFLAAIGTHKNGTWAVQKIVQCVQEPEEMAIIQQNLAPYTPPLLLNDFGNYVVQGALRFGSPLSDFVFDAMIDRCWEIGSGRYGARSTRQTLESPQTSRFNIARVAAALALNSIPLATSANGALLITWLLDTSDLPGRYRVLAARFAPHLPHLCTHKLASTAVLKIINQRADPLASQIILDALLDPKTKVIEEILADQAHGAACMSKILNASISDELTRKKVVDRMRAVLLSLRVTTIPAYRKLQEDLGIIAKSPVGPSSPVNEGGTSGGANPGPSSTMGKSHGYGSANRGQYPPSGQWDHGHSGHPPWYPQAPIHGYGSPASTSPYGHSQSYPRGTSASFQTSAMPMQPPFGPSYPSQYPNYYHMPPPAPNAYQYGSSSSSTVGQPMLTTSLAAPAPSSAHVVGQPVTPPSLSPGLRDINFHPFSPTGSAFGRSDVGV